MSEGKHEGEKSYVPDNWHGYNGDEVRTERVTLEITLPLWGWKSKGLHPTKWDWENICDAGDGLGDSNGRVAVVLPPCEESERNDDE